MTRTVTARTPRRPRPAARSRTRTRWASAADAIRGIAPAAAVSVYKVCGAEGCFPSDSAAAVARAILDGVRVINFSISGGSDPYSDPVELAFLDAYAAGVFVATSAGNSGPGANTTDHRSPWVTTVAASTQSRTFRSTVTLSGDGATATISGASVTPGISTPTPVVLARFHAWLHRRDLQHTGPRRARSPARSSPASSRRAG